MTYLGTRPPLISETNLYELHHRVRLAIKPGITGMWQVSGRSDITDFEEVVRLDKEYISKGSIDDEDDEVTSGEIDAAEPIGRLSGISSAILKGDGLRNNDFVKECMSQGFIFSSMSYKFSHKTRPITIVIDVNFKQIDLKINIVKTYQLEDDGIERLTLLPASDQNLYIDYFQNIAYAVYSNLIEKQKAELVKQTL